MFQQFLPLFGLHLLQGAVLATAATTTVVACWCTELVGASLVAIVASRPSQYILQLLLEGLLLLLLLAAKVAASSDASHQLGSQQIT